MGSVLWAAGVSVAIAGVAGCITTPPPDLPAPAPRRPTILHASVWPSEGYMPDWPEGGLFIVPVEPGDPEQPQAFLWDVFVDYDPTTGSGEIIPHREPPPVVDGGIIDVSFRIPTASLYGFCHRVEFLVAHAFNPPPDGIPNGDNRYDHTPDSVGGDIVTWLYTGGAPVGGCPEYDAGVLQDGGVPPADAPSDGLPIVNQDGGK